MLLVPSGTKIKTHRGRRLGFSYDFSTVYSSDLSGNDGWTRTAGTVLVRVTNGRAFTIGGPVGTFCHYTNSSGSYNRNRRVVCDCVSTFDNHQAGVLLTADTSSGKFFFAAYVVRGLFGDTLAYVLGYGGSPIGGTLQGLVGAGSTRTIVVLRSGRNIRVSCTGSALHSITLAGSIDLTDHDPPGIYYSGAAGGGPVKSTWDNFEARTCSYA
jgi:hypothetical protein